MPEPLKWYDDNADNPPWIKALAEVRRLALSADVRQFEGSKECRGSFAVGFSSGFDGHRCDLVIRRIGSDSGVRIPLTQH
jgi:hypothetical protein